MPESFEVVIVGSGVAGALLANELSAHPAKPRVLILEAGNNAIDDGDRKRFVDLYGLAVDRDSVSPYIRLASTRESPHPSGGVDRRHLVSLGPDDFKSNYARLVGGSTWAWRGNVPRMTPADFELRDRYHVADNWPISYADLLPHYVEAEKQLGVAGDTSEWDSARQGERGAPYPMPPIPQALGDQKFRERLRKSAKDGVPKVDGQGIRVVATPQARVSTESYTVPGTTFARRRCEGNANCIPICPTGAKYDASVHLRLALQKKTVTLRSSCPVTRVRTADDGRVLGVSYRDLKRGAKQDTDVDAKIVVLAANAIETPRLWLYSKLRNDNDLVGRYLMDHLQNEAVCFMPEPIYPFRGPQNTSSIPSFLDHPKRDKFSAFNVSIGNDGWGRFVDENGKSKAPFNILDELLWDSQNRKIAAFGKELQRLLADDDRSVLTRGLRLSFSTEQLPEHGNRVRLSEAKDALGIPRPALEYRVDDYSKESLENARRVCREIIRTAGLTPEGPDDIQMEYAGAGHLMGTCRMGTEPAKSVVDPYGRAHAHPNLWVVGSSVFVTGSAANPTLTLSALTLRSAKEMAKVFA